MLSGLNDPCPANWGDVIRGNIEEYQVLEDAALFWNKLYTRLFALSLSKGCC
jgi:hypothetical protein